MHGSLRSHAFLLLALADAAAAQDPETAVRQLLEPNARPRAIGELRRAGAAGATAVFDAFEAAGKPEVFARALADLGVATASVIPRLLTAIPRHPEPVRSHLLRALTNGALVADADQRGAIRAALPAWLEAGWCYSPAADAPTFAWYEYVRLQRRLLLAERGAEPTTLDQVLAELLAQREGFMPFGALAPPSGHDLSAFGSHGQRELLEGIAESALASRERCVDAAVELARYLACEPPRAGIVLTEGRAGIGENAPDVAAAMFPTLWRRDDWRFACARAVFALHPEAGARQHALRHLLYCDDAAERMRALEAVRQWPGPWDAFAADLAACLQSDERMVVREALVTLGLAGKAAQAATTELERLAGGSDPELAALARRVLGTDPKRRDATRR